MSHSKIRNTVIYSSQLTLAIYSIICCQKYSKAYEKHVKVTASLEEERHNVMAKYPGNTQIKRLLKVSSLVSNFI